MSSGPWGRLRRRLTTGVPHSQGLATEGTAHARRTPRAEDVNCSKVGLRQLGGCHHIIMH